MKVILYNLLFTILFSSCSFVDNIGDKEIKVVGKIYLLKIDESLDGFTLTQKTTENTSTYIIGDKVIKLLFNRDNIFVESVFAKDTNYYQIPYNDSIQYYKANKTDKETFLKLTNKFTDLKEIKIPN